MPSHVPTYVMPDVAEALGRLLRAARDGSRRSVHRLGGHARRHRRSDAARDPAAATVRRARSLRVRRAGGGRHRGAARRPRAGAATVARRGGDRVHGSARARGCPGRGVCSAPACRGRGRAPCCCWCRSKCRREEARRSTALDARARRLRRRRRSAAWRCRATTAARRGCSSCARPCPPASTRSSPRRRRACIRTSRRPRATSMVPVRPARGFAGALSRVFERRGLDYAIWGHVSDGNLHPNVVPRSLDGRAAADATRSSRWRAAVDGDGRRAARRARRRPQRAQAAAAAGAVRRARASRRCARSSARSTRSGSWRRACLFPPVDRNVRG